VRRIHARIKGVRPKHMDVRIARSSGDRERRRRQCLRAAHGSGHQNFSSHIGHVWEKSGADGGQSLPDTVARGTQEKIGIDTRE
jgi:hypothetical protein